MRERAAALGGTLTVGRRAVRRHRVGRRPAAAAATGDPRRAGRRPGAACAPGCARCSTPRTTSRSSARPRTARGGHGRARDPTGRRADGHPDARAGRSGGDPRDRRRPGPGRDPRHHPDDVRPRRVRLRGDPHRSERLPGQGHRAGRAAARRARGRPRRRAAVADRDPAADRGVRQPQPRAPGRPSCSHRSPSASARSWRSSARGSATTRSPRGW